MRIDVSYPKMCLLPGRTFRETWEDPRTGSEVAWRRIVEELTRLGHGVAHVEHQDWHRADVSISINDPRTLGAVKATGLHVCEFLLNEFSFCNEEPFDDYTDVYISPSEAHRRQAIGPWGAPDPSKWRTIELGCDPSASGGLAQIPGRVVYCSSPDRGLHRVLEAWPAVLRSVPGASLHIFYRLEKWFRDFDSTPYYPPIEKLRHRALWCEEALRRMSGPEWGITVRDSVSHDEVLREMAQAEVFLHPCDTTSWSEGFSVTTLEACASGACPVITDCDALGDIYSSLDPVPVGQWQEWCDRVILALTNKQHRMDTVAKARALAERLTWAEHARKLDEVIRERIKS